jgi:hypothetical protein
MILQIPVKPYVKNIIKQHYGKEPIPIRANSDLGSIFLLAMNEKSWLRLAYTVDKPSEENDNAELVICLQEGACVLEFELGGNFARNMQILPDKLAQIGDGLEGYSKIFMKAFSIGYRCLLNSEMSSANAFWALHHFKEDDLTQDNCYKIIQRETREIKDLINNKAKRRFASPIQK